VPALLFDLDGTLVDSVYQHVLAWHEVLGKAGMELSVWRIHRRIGMSGGLFVSALLRETGRTLSETDIAMLQQAHQQEYLAQADSVRPLPGATELLAELTKRGVQWAIATSGYRATAGHALGMLGLPEDAPMITRDMVRHAKPDPDLFLAAAALLDVDPKHAYVVGDSVWGAMEGRRVLNVTWDDGPNKDLNTAAVMASLKQAASKKGANLYAGGDPAKVSGRHISAEYELPFMAHAPMEPGNCTAHYQGTKCELWAPTQVPQDCRDSVATAIGLDPDQVKVNVTLMGGGFGRRLEHDYAVEAALVSKAINAPVKVIWTREDDMRFSTYRPASLHQLSATLDGSGFPVALTHRIIAPSISGQKGQPVPNGVDPDLPDEAGPVYGLPNYSIEYVLTETPVPLGWMRSVYALQAGFALESFIDELAVAAGKDPLQYRLHLLAKDQDLAYFTTTWHTARMRAVLQLAADKAAWNQPLPAGHYRGIACFGCFSSYMAEVVEITMEKDEPRVHRVVAAVDCGQVVNPSIMEQQIQGGIVYGLGNALRAKITIEKGRVVQGNFDDYAPLRMEETPAVEVHAVPSAETPTGIGEPSVPPVAPALCNAIYAATKKRIRALPILS